MSSNSQTGSTVNLVGLPPKENEPESKKIRLSSNEINDVSKIDQEKQKKSRFFGKFRIRKNRKVGNQNGELIYNSPKTRKNATSVTPMSNGLPGRNDSETKQSATTSETEQRRFSSLKSLFGKKEHEINVNRSETTKLFYFGLLLPAMALHPQSLKKCDTHIYDEDFKLRLAAAHINDAINSRGKFGHARALMKSQYVRKCYAIISSPYWEYLIYLFIGLHCFMAFWEQGPDPTQIGQPWNGNWVMNASVLVLDALCTLIYIIDIILWTGFLSWTHFWSAKENFWIRVEFVFTAMFIIDYIIIVLQRTLDKVFAIILIFIFTFSSIGLHLYMADYHDVSQACPDASETNCTSVYSGAFDNIAIATVHMFVLMSTENYPDVIIPAFRASIANFFYFMFYLYAGVFFLTAILLAIIVESYWEYSKKHVKMERLRQREELIRAWNLLDLNGTGFLSVDDPKLLRVFSLLKPKNTEDQNLQLIEYMSENNEDFVIDSYDWTTRLVQTLSIEFEPENNDDRLSDDSLSLSRIRTFCSKIIHADGIGITILVLILLHSIFFCLMWSGISASAQLALQACRTAIVVIFVFEVILRILADGEKLLNILDAIDIIMVGIAVAGNVAWYILWPNSSINNFQLYLGACVVTSSLAVLARLLFNSEQARSAVYILSSIYPVMFDLILLVVIIIYFYAILGLEIFQDNTLEKSSEQGFEGSYVQYGCGVGFQTFGCALMIVFQIVTTNDWHQIMLGAMIDAGWPSAFYFISCYLIIDMIVMNLFVAISIEAYKKLARDDKAFTSKPTTQQEEELSPEETANPESNGDNAVNGGSRTTKKKQDRTLGEAAKDAFTGIFASSRTRKTSNPVAVGGHSNTAGMQFGRIGHRGSIAVASIHTDTSDDSDSGNDTVLSWGAGPSSPRARNRTFRFSSDSSSPRKRASSSSQSESIRHSNTSSDKDTIRAGAGVDRRQKLFKARSERVRKERKERQKQMQQTEPSSHNTLNVPAPKLSISDVVKLKRMVRISKPYHAKSSTEMNVVEGQMFSVSEENGNMYRGPNGWFPKEVALDVSMEAGTGPFAGHSSTPRAKKQVNFKIENEIAEHEPSPPGRLSPALNPQVPHRPSMQRMRIKKDGNDWRRDIHGDMTVMNKQEAQALQKKLKGGRINFERHQSRFNLKSDVSRLSLIGSRRPNNGISQLTIDEKEEESPSEVPVVKVSEPQSSSETSAESNEDTNTSNQKTDTLTVPKSSTKKRTKPKGDGEIPDWAKNFAATTGVVVQNDLKFDESRLKSPANSDDDDHLEELLNQSKPVVSTSTNNIPEDHESPSILILNNNNESDTGITQTKHNDPDVLMNLEIDDVEPASSVT